MNQIFGHLAPGDLLSLSRVSRSFQKLLLDSSSLFLWKAAFGNVPELPPPPEDVPLIEWTNLVFGGILCHVCPCCGETHQSVQSLTVLGLVLALSQETRFEG